MSMGVWALGLAVVATVCVHVSAVVTYDEQVANRAVHYAAAAYCADHWIEDWNCHNCLEGMNGTIVLSIDSIDYDRGYVGYDSVNDQAVLAIQGTDPLVLRGWFEDWETFKWQEYPDCYDCKVHAGYYKCWQILRAQAYDALATIYKKYSPKNGILVTGHSLGAAVATHAAIGLTLHAKEYLGFEVPVTAYTFGEPRVGNVNFANYFHTTVPQYIRVTHNHDIAPHLPPTWMDFRHAPTEVWYHPSLAGGYKVCDGSGEDPTCADSVLAFEYSVADHLVYMGLDMTTNYLGCKL